MTNPLQQAHVLPPFADIQTAHIVPAIESLISDGRAHLAALLQSGEKPNWKNLVDSLEAESDRLNQAWSPVGHLNAVKNSDALREAYEHCVVLLTAYQTEFGQNKALYQAYKSIADSDEFACLSTAQQQSLNNALRDFNLAGVALEDQKKQRFAEIKERLSTLSTQFSNNVLDATQAWYKHIPEGEQAALAGLPDTALAQAAQNARVKSLSGFVVTLDIPSYLSVMTYADSRELREELYRAYVSRASTAAPVLEGGQHSSESLDNTALIEEILSLRHELSGLLDFDNYAELSLATKMADNTEEVIAFLEALAEKSLPVAQKEYAELLAFSREQAAIDSLEAWDIPYFSEKLKQAQYAVSQEELRSYFPASKVVSGMFEVVNRLFGIDIALDKSVETWHEDAQFFRVSRDGQSIAGFYLDLYARADKRGGAWMDECRVRRLGAEGLQLPVAYLTCNFSAPVDDTPSLLTHNEVTTLFHEFGHGLHHMLSTVDVAAVSGINGVPWDAVELPSQFLENWCWDKSVIPMISSHYQSGATLPDELLEKLLAAKNFQSGMQMVRQLEFALFDFRLHKDYQPENPVPVQSVLDKVRKKVSVITPPAYNKFQNSFSHIFGGGYAAGYYSYKWAEVLSADAFSLFEEKGIFDQDTGQRFLQEILQRGGSETPMTLFSRFRGREPEIDALLRHSGIVVEAGVS